jgi:3-hydroxyacyl-CoA dehydrogenase
VSTTPACGSSAPSIRWPSEPYRRAGFVAPRHGAAQCAPLQAGRRAKKETREPIDHSQGGGAGRRRDGGADRRPLRQRRRAGGPVRPAGQGGRPERHRQKAIDGLKKLDPAPLATKDRAQFIDAANYGSDLEQLRGCDLIIEAIAEKLEWKLDLYAKVAPFIRPDAIFASNTSGLSIAALDAGLPEALRDRFCGIHFFNPPRYMALVELIATARTQPAMLDDLEAWLTTRLGKSIVRAKDTPNFVANRIGVFSILAVMHHTARLGLGFDEVDALTGPLIGRPKSATYRTADVVGLDTLAHVVGTMQATLPDDPWHAYFKNPDWLGLIAQGALGQKTKGGIYRKDGKTITVLDVASQAYRPSAGEVAPEVLAILKKRNPADKFAQLRASSTRRRSSCGRSSATSSTTARCSWRHRRQRPRRGPRDALGLRLGAGPFETWQAAGWQAIAAAIQADIDAGLAMSRAAAGLGLRRPPGRACAEGSWSARRRPQAALDLPVYGRQLYPEQVLGEAAPTPASPCGRTTACACGACRRDARIGIVSFKSKMHAIGDEVLDGVLEAVARAERDLDGLVIWHDAPFAVGANLQQVAEACRPASSTCSKRPSPSSSRPPWPSSTPRCPPWRRCRAWRWAAAASS